MKPYILWYTSIIGVEITVTPLIFGAGSTFLIIPIVINTINCIEKFTQEKFKCNADNDNGGYIEFSLPKIKEGGKNHDVELLLESKIGRASCRERV